MRSSYSDLGTLRRTIGALLALVSFFGYIQLKYLDSWSYSASFHQRSLLTVHTVEAVGRPEYASNISNVISTRLIQVHQPIETEKSDNENDNTKIDYEESNDDRVVEISNISSVSTQTINARNKADSASTQKANVENKTPDVEPKGNNPLAKTKSHPKLESKLPPQLFDEVLPLKRRNETDTNYTVTPLMLLFSSWVNKKEKSSVHAATIKLWSSWSFIKPAVVTTDPVVQRYAAAAGWEVSSDLHVHRECSGPPVLAPMFTQLMKKYSAHYYGYSNSDIVYGNGLAETLTFLHEHDVWRNKPLLIVGRRHNVDFVNNSHIALDTPTDVAKLTKIGTLVLRSTDYFFTNKHFPWGSVPEVSIGRPFVVRTIIGYALQKRIAVIEATKTIESVHLTTKDGNFASWHIKGVKCNERVLAKLRWHVPTSRGHCECALLETFKENGEMKVQHRKANKTICH